MKKQTFRLPFSLAASLMVSVFSMSSEQVFAMSKAKDVLKVTAAAIDVVDEIAEVFEDYDKADRDGSLVMASMITQDALLEGALVADSLLSLNTILVENSTVLLLIGDQVAKIQGGHFDNSTLMANNITVHDSLAGYLQTEQSFESINLNLDDSTLMANQVVVDGSTLGFASISQFLAIHNVTFTNTESIINSTVFK